MSRNAFLSLFAVPPLLVAQTGHNAPPKPIAITHVTVIDATGAAAQPDMTVLTQKVGAVVVRGKLLNKAALQKMLGDVESKANGR